MEEPITPTQIIPQEFQAPATQPSSTVFSGPITPPDQATLLAFIRASVSLSANGKSSGTNSTSITNSTETVVQMSNEFVNGVTWDSVNYGFVIKTKAQYLISGMVAYQTTASGKLYEARIEKNGSDVAYTVIVSSNTLPLSVPITTSLDLVVGDVIKLTTFHNSAGAESIYNDPLQTYLTIQKV